MRASRCSRPHPHPSPFVMIMVHVTSASCSWVGVQVPLPRGVFSQIPALRAHVAGGAHAGLAGVAVRGSRWCPHVGACFSSPSFRTLSCDVVVDGRSLAPCSRFHGRGGVFSTASVGGGAAMSAWAVHRHCRSCYASYRTHSSTSVAILLHSFRQRAQRAPCCCRTVGGGRVTLPSCRTFGQTFLRCFVGPLHRRLRWPTVRVLPRLAACVGFHFSTCSVGG